MEQGRLSEAADALRRASGPSKPPFSVETSWLLPSSTGPAWNAGATAWLPRLHGCRSDAGADRAPADACCSSQAEACHAPRGRPHLSNSGASGVPLEDRLAGEQRDRSVRHVHHVTDLLERAIGDAVGPSVALLEHVAHDGRVGGEFAATLT
jgi:hypothetical protein